MKTDWTRLYKERKKERRVTEEEEERKQKDGEKKIPTVVSPYCEGRGHQRKQTETP